MRNYNKVFMILVNTIATTLLVIFIVFSNFLSSDNWAIITSILSLFTLGIQIINLRKLNYGFYDFILYFFILSHLFMFGNVYLIALGKVQYISWTLIFRYSTDIVINAAVFVLIYLQILNLGIIIFTKNKSEKLDADSKINTRLVKYIGMILLSMALPFRILIDVKNTIAAQSIGSYYALQSQSGIADDIAILFVPSLLMLLNSSISKKFKNIITVLFVLYSILVMVLTGDRRYQVIGVIVYALNYMYINKIKIKPHKLIFILFFGIILLNLIMQISAIRQTELVTPFVFFAEYGSNLFSLDFIYKIFGEFGISFITVVIAIKNIPSLIPYQHGLSFFGAIPSILPIGWLFPEFFEKVSIFRKLYAIEGYPVGASLPGELFANFGWWGILIVFWIGYFVPKLLKFSSRRQNNAFGTAQYFSVFYVLINIVRASFLEITRNLAVVIILPYLIFFVLKLFNRKTKFNSSKFSELRR